MPYNKQYTQEEIEFIKDNYGKLTYDQIAIKLNRPKHGIRAKAQSLGITTCNYFTDDDIEFIKNNYLDMTYSKLAEAVGHPEDSVRSKICSSDLPPKAKAKTGANTAWTETEEKFLINNYSKLSRPKLAKELNRTLSAIKNKIHLLDLDQNREEMRKAPELNLTEIDKAYIAGIIDGEGCLSIGISEQANHLYFSPSIAIYNTNYQLIDYLVNSLKTTKYSQRIRDEQNKKGYVVNIHKRAHIKLLLRLIKKHLIVKAKLADLMLEFLEHNWDEPECWFTVARFRIMQDPRGKRHTKNLKRLLKKIQEHDAKRYTQLELNIS